MTAGLAPDVVRVDVSTDDKGLLTLALKFANRTALQGDDLILIFLSTLKTDFAIAADWSDGTYGLYRWNGSDYDSDIPQDTLLTRDGMTVFVNKSELENAPGYLIHVTTRADWDGERYQYADSAPDAIDGGLHVWPYVLGLAPELKSVKPTFAPSRPRAGKRFSVSGARILLGTGETVPAERVTCTAKLGGRALRSAGRCAWALPAGARGKKLTVIVKAAYHGASRSAGPFVFTVRG